MAAEKPSKEESAPNAAPLAENGELSSPLAESGLEEGMRLFREKRWDAALTELLRVDTGNLAAAEQEDLSYYLGLCYTKLARYDDALGYLEQTVTAGSNALRVYQCRMALAYIYILTGRCKMAEFELNRLQSNGFESAQLYNTLAYAAWTQKRGKDAVELYEKALDLDPDNTTAMNSMGYILADLNINVMRGLRLCRKAAGRQPQNPAYLDSLGWAYYKSGGLAEAQSWLRRALDLAPQEQEIQEHFRTATGEAV